MENVHVSRTTTARIPALTSAHLAIAAAVATPVMLACLWLLSPKFNPAYRLMSEYAFGNYGWFLSLTFLAWGLSTCALALAVRPLLPSRGGRVGVAFLVVAGAGQALAAAFDIRHDIMHNIAGAMGIVGLPVAAVLVSRSLGQRRLLVLAHLTWISVIVWIASFVLLVVTMIHVNGSLPDQAPPSLPHGVIGLVGWANRLLVLLYCGWVAAVGAHVIRLRRDGA
jgi:hypothetical protein